MRYSPYPAYKPTGLTWLGGIPSEWGTHRLKWSVTGCDNGVWGEEPDGAEDDIVCLRVADFDRNSLRVSTDSLTVRSVDARLRNSRKLNKHDLLLEKSGGGEKQLVGCVVHFDHEFDAVCSNFVARMAVATGQSPRFWVYAHAALYAGKLNYLAIKQTTGIQNLDSAEYLNTLVAYPSEPEQVQIAAFLDWKTGQIDALIAKKQALVERLKEKRLAVITQAVTNGLDPSVPLRDSGISWLGDVPKHWNVKRLKYLATEGKGCGIQIGPFGGMLTELIHAESGEFKLYGQENVLGGDFAKGTRWITPEQFTSLIQYRAEAGDFLFTRKGSIGGCAIFPASACAGIIDSDTIRLRVDELRMNRQFLRYAFRDSLYLQAQVQLMKRGAILSGLNTTTIADLLIAEPPLEEQVRIVTFLDSFTDRLDDLQYRVETAIARLTEYRTALITAATTGKIDVRQIEVPVHT